MGRVKYESDEHGRFFDVSKNLKEIWGIDTRKDSLIGLTLKDRKDHNHIVKIGNICIDMGILVVKWKDGGWNCLDHALEQFEKLE